MNIINTINDINWALSECSVSNFEIVVVDDCSSDNTADVVRGLGLENVRLHQNERNLGFGGSFFAGLAAAKGDYVAQVPGDNEIARVGIYSMLKNFREVDLTCTYTVNMEERSSKRRAISRIYSLLINLMFPTEMIYYNGPFVVRSELIRSLNINSNSFAFQAQFIISAIMSGATFCEKPIWVQSLPTQNSAALKLGNVFRTIYDIIAFRMAFKFKRIPTLSKQRIIIL